MPGLKLKVFWGDMVNQEAGYRPFVFINYSKDAV